MVEMQDMIVVYWEPSINIPELQVKGIAEAASVGELTVLGFTPHQARYALKQTSNNVNAAAEWLFANLDKVPPEETTSGNELFVFVYLLACNSQSSLPFVIFFEDGALRGGCFLFFGVFCIIDSLLFSSSAISSFTILGNNKVNIAMEFWDKRLLTVHRR